MPSELKMETKQDLKKKLRRIRLERLFLTYNRQVLTAAAMLVLILFLVILASVISPRLREQAEQRRQESLAQESREESIAESMQQLQESRAEEAARLESLEAAAKEEAAAREALIREVLSSYQRLGIVNVDDGGYLNMREQGFGTAHIIGKLYNHSACDILEDTGDGWYRVSSGGFEGYVNSRFLLTDTEAEAVAAEEIRDRAIVTSDGLNIRTEPTTDSDVVSTALAGERYEVLSREGEWVQTPAGYMNTNYLTVQPCLNEARKLDLRSMVLNLYDNLGISNVSGYLNIREKPGENGKIIGKLTSKAACNILSSENGWYKIRSGKVSGYVKSDYILTGDAAKEAALKEAQLMAIVTTDVLNVRSQPSLSASVWTQISSNERYPVISQLDGWVELELEEETNAFAATEYVDVRYALNEAIKFSPLEEAAANSGRIRSSLVNYALKFVGNPYVWGGTSLTKGCDCSGFTMQILKQYGVSLPHYSGSQAQMGKKVTSANMRPGDLIFYANSSGTINHVAIYIGNGQIVHAASRRSGIRISSWNYRTPKVIRNMLGD